MNTHDTAVQAFLAHAGNVSAAARDTGLSRRTVAREAKKAGVYDQPIAEGSVRATEWDERPLPDKGKVHRYILTSAQNNTKLWDKLWTNILALVDHYDAELFVGTMSYNLNAYGKTAVKRGHAPDKTDRELWYDTRLTRYINATDDKDVLLAPGLMWCGRVNIIPTAQRPLSRFNAYTSRASGIFPHNKIEMVSVPSMKNEATKFNYTTGTVTQRNYIMKKAGLLAERLHAYGCLVVEVNHEGDWWCRQVLADHNATLQDLDVVVKKGKVTMGNKIFAVSHGDIHYDKMDKILEEAKWGKDGYIDTYQFSEQHMHDLVDFNRRRHYNRRDPHKMFELYCQGMESVEGEMKEAADFLGKASRPFCKTLVIDSNHDNDFDRWLREADYRSDPVNALYFLEAQREKYEAIATADKGHHMIEWAMRRAHCPKEVRFLRADESHVVCKTARSDGIECGMHGHLGIHGARATPSSLARMGRAATTQHTHVAGIIDELWTGGVTAQLDQGYNVGPDAWSNSDVLIYGHGQRAIITWWKGQHRALEE